MSKVFPYDDVVHKKVPKLDDFPRLVGHVISQLGNAKGVRAAVICGSAVSRSFNYRSDIDCVVVYDPSHTASTKKVLVDLHMAAVRLNIPLELIPTDMHLANRGSHSIGASFAKHLERCVAKGGAIKENPLKLFSLEGLDATQDAKSYVCIKRQKIEKGMLAMQTMETRDLYQFLQKVIDAPFHAVRKLLFAEGADLADDSKKAVIRRFLEDANASEKKIFNNIVSVDRHYTEELASQVEAVRPSSYLDATKNIQNLVPAVVEFLRLCAFRIS